MINLGPVFDPEGDSPRLQFDDGGISFIRIDKSDMKNVTLSVDQIAPIGVYTALIRLSDDNEVDPVSKEYRLIIIVQEGSSSEAIKVEDLPKPQAAPLIEIVGIDFLGEMTILFLEEMTIPRDLTQIDETVLDIDIISVDVESAYRRDFTWYVSDYNTTNCTIQIVWDSPPWVSSTSVRDKLSFKILRKDKFIDRARRLKDFDD